MLPLHEKENGNKSAAFFFAFFCMQNKDGFLQRRELHHGMLVFRDETEEYERFLLQVSLYFTLGSINALHQE